MNDDLCYSPTRPCRQFGWWREYHSLLAGLGKLWFWNRNAVLGASSCFATSQPGDLLGVHLLLKDKGGFQWKSRAGWWGEAAMAAHLSFWIKTAPELIQYPAAGWLRYTGLLVLGNCFGRIFVLCYHTQFLLEKLFGALIYWRLGEQTYSEFEIWHFWQANIIVRL